MGSGTTGPAAYGTLLAALPPERAGVGSAVNDTVQQVGQALSVAVLGSVLSAIYSGHMPKGVTGAARQSIGNALALAAARGDAGLASAARTAFTDAMSTTAIVGVCCSVAAVVLAFCVLRPAPRPGGVAEPTAGGTTGAADDAEPGDARDGGISVRGR